MDTMIYKHPNVASRIPSPLHSSLPFYYQPCPLRCPVFLPAHTPSKTSLLALCLTPTTAKLTRATQSTDISHTVALTSRFVSNSLLAKTSIDPLFSVYSQWKLEWTGTGSEFTLRNVKNQNYLSYGRAQNSERVVTSKTPKSWYILVADKHYS
jgi:hypothetical protein